jgi:catechol 2,3-dioxygenase-like lactoylglutathione lyase family enzyme
LACNRPLTARRVAAKLGITVPGTIGDWALLARIAGLLARSALHVVSMIVHSHLQRGFAMNNTAPNLSFSHMGLNVRDLARMERFYTEVMGFTVTDRGEAAGIDLVFMSRDPLDHHQIILATGRPDELPPNTRNPMFGPSINQISFRMGALADLRYMYRRLKEQGYVDGALLLANHGISWSIYFPDPEGNILEVFVDSGWYIKQPVMQQLDFNKSDAEIYALTETLCRESKGFEPRAEWRKRVSKHMVPFEPASGA